MNKNNYVSSLFSRIFSMLLLLSNLLSATDYNVGPGQPLNAISDVPWTILEAGDRVFIHWRSTPYREKWVINRKGTATERIEIIGISGPLGQQPVIDGNDAVTASGLNYWNESRGIIKIGGSNVPADDLPSYITIENLEIKSCRPAYRFTNDNGQIETYTKNAASIYVEKAENLIIRNCTLHDSGNGLFIGANNGQTQNILIEKNYIFNNGDEGSIFEHNAYTAAINITFQFNRFGPLRSGAGGNNLKDRSAGLTVRYNWIEGGNRQLDLVDAEDSKVLVNHPSYNTTYVYGNILIEPDRAGNSQIALYGGDSGTFDDYRKGDLYFYNNTIISTRTGNTTLIALSTNEETAHVFNNIIYTTASGNRLAMIDNRGIVNLHHNWIKADWRNCHCTPEGTINNQGNNLNGLNPSFIDFENQNFMVASNSSAINAGDILPSFLIPDHNLIFEYKMHLESSIRDLVGSLDIGAFEFVENLSTEELNLEHPISILPNPTSNIAYISSTNNLLTIEVFDNLSQSLFSTQTNIIDLSSAQPGLYFAKITTKKGRVLTKKIIKN